MQNPPKTIAVGKNEVTQKETKDLIRILNLSSKWGFPPSVEEAQWRKGEMQILRGEKKPFKVPPLLLCTKVDRYVAGKRH